MIHSRHFPAPRAARMTSWCVGPPPTDHDEDEAVSESDIMDATYGIVPGADVPPDVAPPPPPARKFEWIAASLRQLRVSYLRLEGTRLGDVGAHALADELACGTAGERLKALYLGGNGIGDEGAEALAEALRHRPACKLRQLFMERNAVGPAGCALLYAVCDVRGVEVIGLPPPPPPSPHVLPTAPPPAGARAPSAARVAHPPEPALLPCNRANGQERVKPSAPRRRMPSAVMAPRPARSQMGAPAPVRPNEPRFRATRPCVGEGVRRYDLMPCARLQKATDLQWAPG
jgi:hypothetical protein